MADLRLSDQGGATHIRQSLDKQDGSSLEMKLVRRLEVQKEEETSNFTGNAVFSL